MTSLDDRLDASRQALANQEKQAGTFEVQAPERETYFADWETAPQVGQTPEQHQEELGRMGALPEQAQVLPPTHVSGESQVEPDPAQDLNAYLEDYSPPLKTPKGHAVPDDHREEYEAIASEMGQAPPGVPNPTDEEYYAYQEEVAGRMRDFEFRLITAAMTRGAIELIELYAPETVDLPVDSTADYTLGRTPEPEFESVEPLEYEADLIEPFNNFRAQLNDALQDIDTTGW